METVESKLNVSRHAAWLFLAQGFSATSGADIAKAAGLSERTIWRYFRTKEQCAAPLFACAWAQFARELEAWPATLSLETHLAECYRLENQPTQFLEDGLLIARLVAALPDEPDLRAVWLLSYHAGEDELAAIIARRISRASQDYDIRLCAASVMAAIRVVDETLSVAAIRHGQAYGPDEIATQMARAMRAAATLDFCDPVAIHPFGTAPASA